MRIRHETYATMFNTVYVGLMTNLLVVVACAPLLAVLLLTDPARTWPLLALLAPLSAPGLAGVFGVLRAFSQEQSTAVFRTFGRVARRAWWRALALGVLGSAALVVLGVDARWALGQASMGALALPVLVMLMALVVAAGVVTLVALSERPAVRLRQALKVCGYLVVRRWYISAVTLVVLSMAGALLATAPALALGVASAPLLYLVWANCRFTLRPALHPGEDPPATARRRTASPGLRPALPARRA